ncbi:MAG: proteasome assembly chaperone family protein [Thaumarchaeota archaeon]|nr:proteasome assembly chaperone family protein [Nitrososphaerota archaeon]
MSTIEILPQGTKLDGCSLITGFHGIGAAGYWTIKYLQDKLQIPRVAFVNSSIIPPVTSTAKGRLVSPYELYRKENLVFFKAEIPPQREEEIKFYGELAAWIVDSGMKEVALVGGLDINLKHDESTFRLVHTSIYKPTGELEKALILEDDHLIVGPVAVMLNQFEMKGFPAFAILAYASPERMDPRAVAVSIGVLGKHYGFEVDVTPLIKGAEAIEMEVAKRENYVKKGVESMYA